MKLHLGKWYIEYERDAREQTKADELKRKLLKFCDINTPKKYAAHGESWGEGQIEYTSHESDGVTETYRGKLSVNCLDFPTAVKDESGNVIRDDKGNAAIVPTTVEGLPIIFKCDWVARKIIAQKSRNWQVMEQTWTWELLVSTTFSFAIVEFYQNKTCRREEILYPKRLFFRSHPDQKNSFVEGFFSQRHDPANLLLENGDIIDPLQK